MRLNLRWTKKNFQFNYNVNKQNLTRKEETMSKAAVLSINLDITFQIMSN